MKSEFGEFNKRECLKSNIKIVVGFILILFGCVVLDVALFKVSQPYMETLDNTFADLIAIVMFLFFTLAILIIYSFIAMLRIKLYRELLQNLKSLIGISVCNIVVAVFLFITIRPLIGCVYLGIVFVLCSLALAVRYSSITLKVKRIESEEKS